MKNKFNLILLALFSNLVSGSAIADPSPQQVAIKDAVMSSFVAGCVKGVMVPIYVEYVKKHGGNPTDRDINMMKNTPLIVLKSATNESIQMVSPIENFCTCGLRDQIQEMNKMPIDYFASEDRINGLMIRFLTETTTLAFQKSMQDNCSQFISAVPHSK